MVSGEESCIAEAKSNSGCYRLAPRKEPERLHDLLLERVSALVTATTTHHRFTENMPSFCDMLSTSLPLAVRTIVMKKVASAMKITSLDDLKVQLLLHLLINVKHIHLRAEPPVHLDQEACDDILRHLEGVTYFRLESLCLEGITAEQGLLSNILNRSPRRRSIHVSGELCSEVLNHLQEQPCDLQSLRLDSCNVCDADVIRALVRPELDYLTLFNVICSGNDEDVRKLGSSALQTLCYLSVESPRLTACGALVLLISLRNLQQIHYTAWISPIADTLLFLRQLNPAIGTFSINFLAQFQPTEDALRNLQRVCPRLKSLMIESYDPTLTTLAILAECKELTKLSLRLVSEELIVSAVKAMGKQLLELELEFEEYTYHSISLKTLTTIQEYCPHLQRLEMKHVNITSSPEDFISSKSATAFRDLKHLILSSAVIQSAALEILLKGNKALLSLVLDVNQDGLTDTVLDTFITNNELHQLGSIFLGAGSLSIQALTSLLTLPKLKKLSLDLKRFPFIPVFAFSTLERTLTKGNLQCVLENVIRED